MKIKNRLRLWEVSISETMHILQTALRADAGTKQETQIHEQTVFEKARDSTALYDRPFPHLAECGMIYQWLVSLAAVYFCRIYNIGYGDEVTEENTNTFRSEHLEKILARIFRSGEERKRYDEFLKWVCKLRNEMLGHQDASAYQIKNRDWMTTMRGSSSFTEDIAIVEYWVSVLEPLRIATLEYINEI